ncbi:hypothetical protein ACTL6U_20040 [Rhodovibrionaceae bacterium A322]
MATEADAEEIFIPDVGEEDLEDPRFRAFFRLWQSHVVEGIAPISSFDLMAYPPSDLPYLGIIDVEDDGGLRTRLVGTELADQAKQETTGRLLQEIEDMEHAVERMQHVVKTGRPYFSNVPFLWSNARWKRYHSLVCPYSDPVSGKVTLLTSLIIVQ